MRSKKIVPEKVSPGQVVSFDARLVLLKSAVNLHREGSIPASAVVSFAESLIDFLDDFVKESNEKENTI